MTYSQQSLLARTDLSIEIAFNRFFLKVEPFECSSEARPPASIVWTKDGKEIAEGKQLSLSGPVSRSRR